MSCVIRNSKEFKDLVNKFDIHPDNLEVILHKYLNTEDRMPTDLEIMAELKGKPFNSSLEDFQWYAKNMLYEPLRYSSLDIAMSKSTDLRNIFGDSAVTVYRNSTGEYVVNVGTPKFENLPFVIDNSLVDELLEISRETNPYHQVFKTMVELIGKQNISIKQITIKNEKIRKDGNPASYFPAKREIAFYPENLVPKLKDFTEKGKKSVIFKILAHELVHQFTHSILATPIEELRTEAEKKFHKDILALYEEAKKHISTDSYYGMKNVFEFIAEAITDRTFQKELAKIKSTKNKNLWQKLVDIFSRVFEKLGVNIHDTLLSDILSSTEELMNDVKAIKEENALMDEIFQDEMSESENEPLGFKSESLDKLVNKYANKISDYTYYMLKVGETYAVNVPVNSKETLEEAREKVRNLLKENGLDPDRYNIGKEFRNALGRTVIYVSPRARKSIVKTAKESKVTKFTEREKEFIKYLWDVRPDLAQRVINGKQDINELMLHEDELAVFAEPLKFEKKEWSTKTLPNSFEVSTLVDKKRDAGIIIDGDSRFSAKNAIFKKGTIIKNLDDDGKTYIDVDVSGMSIEDVYQHIIKKSRKNKPPATNSIVYNEEFESIKEGETLEDLKKNRENYSYEKGYLPLWKIWAEQHPKEMEELRKESAGKVLTDSFGKKTLVNQARALAEILNGAQQEFEHDSQDDAYQEDTSKDDKIQDTNQNQTIREENKSYMERAITITQQIDNLTNATIMSATEVRHIAEQAVYWISDHITRIQEEKGYAAQVYGEHLKDKDFASMSRADVVKIIGADNLIARCKEQFSLKNIYYNSFSTRRKSKLITDNWRAIMLLASDAFLNVEDFSIVSSKDGKTNEVNTEIMADADNFSTSSNMEYDVLENEGDLQEHWQVETKTLDVLATMSQKVKQALLKCYLLDNDGNKITSEFGINERVNVREATNSILKWTQGALTLEQMIAKLKEKANNNPWVRQIIARLEDRSGKEVDFQSQFFGTFYKPFQSYAVVIEENGKYKSIIVNENPALSEAMNQVRTLFKIGEHPMFNAKGVNEETYAKFRKEYDGLSKYTHKDFDINKEENKKEVAKSLSNIANLLGYSATPEMVAANLNEDTFKLMCNELFYIKRGLESNINNPNYEPFEFNLEDGINGNMKRFLQPITASLEDTAISAFYDNGKMYQSHITPSYTSKLFQKFKLKAQAFMDFIKEEYGKYFWFFSGGDLAMKSKWRNPWLRRLVTEKEARRIFKHKVQLNFNKKSYMRGMSDMEYVLSLITEYFSESKKNDKNPVAWFKIPIMSNKPSSEFIRFYCYRHPNYKDTLVDGFKMIFDQELSRIQTVERRNETIKEDDPKFIKNFDTNGKKFMFLDFMNEYLTGKEKSSELGKLLRDKLDGKKDIDEVKLNTLVKETIMKAMEAKAESIVANWEKQGILEAAKKVKNIGNTAEEIRENLKNFIWNDTFASMNILQLAVTDIAFYKDAEDLQKRLAQIHSPGIRGNAKATDYEGKMVTDGNFRTIKLADFDTFISNVIDNVSIVFDKKIANAPESAKAALKALKESLVGENGAFRYINVVDSQGYSSPTSYRKKALIFGKWSREAEEVWNKLRKGEYNYRDLEIAFQPLKPFVYSQIEKNSEIANGPMKTLKVPVQFKNSEYLLIMADALLRGEETGKPNILRALYNVMEESHFNEDGTYKLDGIDTVQFESTVKSGLMGKISLNDLLNDPDGEAKAEARLRESIYEGNSYDNSAVDTVPFEDYCLQQEVPEHFKEHEQIHPSQLRYIIISELENFNNLDEPVTYNLEGKKVNAQEFKTEYENTIAENIQESLDELAEELSLTPDKIGNIKDRNITLSKILQKEILSSPRYGIDLLQACSVNENGEFRIPLGDPIQSKRVEQLINSIIKNRVNKQKIAGGPVVQVTSFGTSKELNIRFKDKNGNLLKTKAEWASTEAQGKDEKSIDKGYKEYIRENQASIAYFEVFAPIYSNKLFNLFSDKNGFINIKAIEILCPDLLKMVGIRIPSEEKYSAAPLKIAGFLPREAGDGIMFPADITLLTNSDFDIDKSYLMRLVLDIKENKENKEVRDILYKELLKLKEKDGKKLKYDEKKMVNELLKQFLDDPMDSKALVNQQVAEGYITLSESEYDVLLKTYLSNKYTVTRPTEGRNYRNNKIVDMTYEVLTHETQADKIFNPSSFDQQKKMGYLVTAYKEYSDKYSWEELKNMPIDKLKDLINKDKNLSYMDTHVQFYKQNNAAASLVGVFAVNRVAHAVIESGSNDKNGASIYYVNVDKVCNLKRNFEVAGMGFGGSMPFDMRYDRQNQLIGKVFGSLLLASTDAAKEPVLNLMNINMNTVNILTTLIRLGMPFDDAALFLSQSTISDLLEQFSRENINGYKSLDRIIQEKLNKLKKDHNINEDSVIANEELTREELIEGIKPDAKPEIAYKVLYAFSKFQKIADALRMPTFATRFNSITNAVGPLVIDNLITEYQMDNLSNSSYIVDFNGNTIDIMDIFRDHPILDKFKETIGMAKNLFGNMPANSQGFRYILDYASNYNLDKVLFGDRKLLSALSDFYQSYLLIKKGVIKANELEKTISEFPKTFMKNNYKEKYPDNALIQAIKYGTDKSGRATLQIDITGLDTQQKEKYINAWIDLHKENPELSFELFKYNFFRSGIGFSPKTFMSLVPVFVKERIAGYVDTFRKLPSTTPEIILDQFIRNNWDSNKLVPRKQVKHFEIAENGNYLITDPSDISNIRGVKYFKVKINGKDMMFKTLYDGESSMEVTEVKPLGSNKEYIEMSESNIEKPLFIPVEAKVETTEAEVGKEAEIPDAVSDNTEINDPSSTRDELKEVLYKILVIEGKRTEEGATKWISNFKSKSENDKKNMKDSTKDFFKNRLEQLGLKDKYDDDKIEEIFSLIC